MPDKLFAQHPPPWTFDDCREGHEGEINVYDDCGGIGFLGGDMEDCTMADILLAHAIAALPELIKANEAAIAELIEHEHQVGTQRVLALLRAALAKAGATEKDKTG